MVQEIHDGVYWLHNCHKRDEGNHIHMSVYLIEGDSGYILIDSGSHPHQNDIKSQIKTITDELDAIVLTTSDLHHSGNTREIRDQYDEAKLYVPFGGVAGPEALGMGSAMKYNIGGSMDICGRTLGFPVPPLGDRGHQTWIVDQETQTLFTAEGFGHHHSSTECNAVYDGENTCVEYENIREFHEEALPWLQYVDPDRLSGFITDIIADWNVENIAPVHGNPVSGECTTEYLEGLRRSIGEIAGEA